MSTALSKSSLQVALDDLGANISLAEENLERSGRRNLALDLRATFETALAEVRALPSSGAAARPIEQAELRLATAAATAGDLLAKISTDAGPGEAAIHGRFRQPLLKLLRELAEGHDANAPDNWRDVLHNGIGGDPPEFSPSELGADAEKWAEAFVKTIYHRGCRHTHDVGFMLGWFANAIEYGHQAKEERRALARPAGRIGRALAQSTSDVDYTDSGMKVGERGTPYTMDEVTLALGADLDLYHRELLQFLVRRVNRLEVERVKDLNVMSTQGQEIERLRAEIADSGCARHAGVAHGKEAEELRSGIEKLMKDAAEGRQRATAAVKVTELGRLLDKVDARDSLAYLESKDLPRGIDGLARKQIAELKEYADLTVRRYQRLRVIGVAPAVSGADEMHGTSRMRVLRFQNLDDFLDEDLKLHPTRGESAELLISEPSTWASAKAAGAPRHQKLWDTIRTAEAETAGDKDRVRAEVVFDATELRVEEHETRQVAQSLILQADDAMNRAIMALRLEVPASIADEIAKRYHTVYQAFVKRATLPSHELVALRHFHENVTAWARRWLQHMDGPALYDGSSQKAFLRSIVDRGGQLLMVPPAASAPVPVPVTRRADGAYTAGPPPDGRTVAEHLDELTGPPRATEPANQCQFIGPGGERCILRHSHEGKTTEAGVHVFGTPHYDRYTQPVIEAAKRVVARMDTHGAPDQKALVELHDLVGHLNTARSKGDHQ